MSHSTAEKRSPGRSVNGQRGSEPFSENTNKNASTTTIPLLEELLGEVLGYLERRPRNPASATAKRNDRPLALLGIVFGWLMMRDSRGKPEGHADGDTETRVDDAHRRENETYDLLRQPLVLGALGIALGAALGAGLPAGSGEKDVMVKVLGELRKTKGQQSSVESGPRRSSPS